MCCEPRQPAIRRKLFLIDIHTTLHALSQPSVSSDEGLFELSAQRTCVEIVEVEEKPGNPKTNFAVIGYYMYDGKVFDFIKQQELSERGEFEITDVNNEYVKRGEMEYDILEGEWMDAGTFESLQLANQMLLKCNNEVRK